MNEMQQKRFNQPMNVIDLKRQLSKDIPKYLCHSMKAANFYASIERQRLCFLFE